MQACEIKWLMMNKIISKNIQNTCRSKNLFNECKKQNIKMAIASSSIRDYLDLAIKKMKIENYFEIIISGDDVKIANQIQKFS